MMQKIGDYLLRRLEEVGIRHIFGVPGDYNLELLQQLEDRGHPQWVGNCNELNAAYAADGYARLSGLSVLIVANGVGSLSAINGIAGAYAEHVPVICICGSPPVQATVHNRMMHHTLADGGQNNFHLMFEQITAAQAQLTPGNAAREIDRLILTAWQTKRPVYLELPPDIAHLEIEAPESALRFDEPKNDAQRLGSCAGAILTRLRKARSPALLLDMDAWRFDVLKEIRNLAEKLQLPVAALPCAKSTFSEQSPLFAGIYAGASSKPGVRHIVENSDCLITIGLRRVDLSSGFFTDAIPPDAIHLNGHSAEVDAEFFEAITLRAVLTSLAAFATSSDVFSADKDGAAALCDDGGPCEFCDSGGAAEDAEFIRLDKRDKTLTDTASQMESPVKLPATGPAQAPAKPAEPAAPGGDLLTHAEYWSAIQNFIQPGDVIIAESGTANAGASGLALPEGCAYVTQSIWGAVGHSLGALLGTLLAAPQRRHLLFIGDGAFQFTVQELSTILRHNLKPHIFVLNNAGYTIEKAIPGRNAKYNDIANWRYANLPAAFCRRPIKTFVAQNKLELQTVLKATQHDLMFVEIVLQPEDAPAGMIRFGHMAADLDYGSRGPQHTPGSRIPVPGDKEKGK